MTDFSDWVDDTALAREGVDTDADMARLFGVKPSTVGRWRKAADPPSRETLRSIALGLKVPMVLVLEKAGYLTAAEAGITEVEVARPLSNKELADEIRRRLSLLDDSEGGSSPEIVARQLSAARRDRVKHRNKGDEVG